MKSRLLADIEAIYDAMIEYEREHPDITRAMEILDEVDRIMAECRLEPKVYIGTRTCPTRPAPPSPKLEHSDY